MATSTLKYYIDRYVRGVITPKERNNMSALLENPDSIKELDLLLDDSWQDWLNSEQEFSEVAKRVNQAVASKVNATQNTIPMPHRTWFNRRVWLRYAAAVLILLGVSAYWLFFHQQDKKSITNLTPSYKQNDIVPGSEKAILTLADGTTVTLDSAANGAIAQQGNASVIKLANGELLYKSKGSASNETLMNTMHTPKGGQYRLVLPDGTRVWLNAVSSITYPTVFNGSVRKVKLNGEAYFEVAKNTRQPFIVETANDEITVLGTAFNVNTYTDEPSSKTSLIEGSIKVNGQLLQPGQAYQAGRVINTHVQQDIAWKNGGFNFNGMDLQTAFRQLARWYNITVRYEDNIPPKKIWGEIGRDLNLSQVISALEDMDIHTRLNGNELIVLSK